jgi:hypothetical protein
MFIDANDRTFMEEIDYILLNSNDDIKMKNAISFLDAKSQQKGLTIYQIIYELFQQDNLKEKFIQWTKNQTL